MYLSQIEVLTLTKIIFQTNQDEVAAFSFQKKLKTSPFYPSIFDLFN